MLQLLRRGLSSSGRGGTAVLMMNMGGPQSSSEVAPFLRRIFLDREIIHLPFSQKRVPPSLPPSHPLLALSLSLSWCAPLPVVLS